MPVKRTALLAAVGLLGACGAGTGEADERGLQSNAAKPALSEPQATSDDAANASPKAAMISEENRIAASAGADILRPANFYRLDWEDDAALCSAAISSLNKPYAAPAEIVADRASDYAYEQALQFVGSDDNVRWTLTPGETAAAPFASIDYFNDGVSRLVVRLFGKLAGSNIIGLGVEEDGGVAMLSFGHAGLAAPEMPAIDDLHAKLTYSVSDIIQLKDRNYSLVAPLRDFDAAGRVFLISWRAKDATAAPRRAADYYPAVSCVFSPETATGER